MNIVEAILYNAVAGGVELNPTDLTQKGAFDASGGAYPTPAVAGDYYIISVGGTLPLGAVVANEWIWYDGTNWTKTPALTTGVSMVNLKTGNVTINADDIDDTATTNKFVEATDISNWNAKLDPNVPITGATKTKITYDADGLVTAGADATTADIADSLNKRYVTDANLTVIGNTSGTNSGDETTATIKTKLGITTLSGSNTGDETASTIKTKLGITTLSGDNTGDETKSSIETKLSGSTTVTLQGNTFNGNSQLIQATADGKFPALDGSNIINLPSGFADPMTTRGDIIIRNASNVTARLGKGTAGQVIKSDGTDVGYATLKTSELNNDSNFVSDASYVHTDNNLTNTLKTNYDSAYTHISNTSNPHSVTKTQVGLSNVDDVQQLPSSYLDTDVALSANSDAKVPSQKAVKAYADTKEPALPSTPVNPSSKYLNGNREWSDISIGSGGYASNLYFTETASAIVPTYKQLSYILPATETIKSVTVNNTESIIESYIFDTPIGFTNLDAGSWFSTLYAYVSSIAGVSNLKMEIYKRTAGGVETKLFEKYSLEIENTVGQYIRTETIQNNFVIDATDYLVAKVYGKTTAMSNRTIYYVVGDGNASYVNTPLALRHSQLRGKNDEVAYQHIDSTDRTKINNLSGTNSGDETKSSIETKLSGSTVVTLQGNTFNGVSQLVQTDATGKLPAIDGSQLTNLPSGEVTTASNVGTGAGQVYKTKTGTDIKLKTIKAGTGVTITNNIDDITIDATGTGGGEANTASNYGTQGAGLYDSKNGVDLRFKSLDNPSGKITLTANNTNHTVELGVNITKSDVGLSNVVNSDTTTTANITDSTNKRFVSDAQKTVIGNTSGTNTGDETNSTIKTKLGASSTSTDGYLSSTDWNIFNGKQNSLGFTAVPNTRTINGNALSADITLTLGEVNTASNSASGTGEGNIYKTKVSQDLVFKKLKAGTNISLTDGTDDITINASGGSGDMILANVQSVTGLKTFDKEKIAMKGASTGTNIISVANTSVTNYTNILPAKDGTFAMLTDITAVQNLVQYKQAQSIVQTLTDGATITPDWNSGQMATLTLGGNRTLANPTNLLAGTTMQIKITQDATGSRTLAYGTNYKWATGADKTLSTAANAVDILTLSCFDGTNIYCTLLKAFA